MSDYIDPNSGRAMQPGGVFVRPNQPVLIQDEVATDVGAEVGDLIEPAVEDPGAQVAADSSQSENVIQDTVNGADDTDEGASEAGAAAEGAPADESPAGEPPADEPPAGEAGSEDPASVDSADNAGKDEGEPNVDLGVAPRTNRGRPSRK